MVTHTMITLLFIMTQTIAADPPMLVTSHQVWQLTLVSVLGTEYIMLTKTLSRYFSLLLQIMYFENCQIVDTETWIQDLPFSNQQGASVDPMWLKLYSAKYDLLQFE